MFISLSLSLSFSCFLSLFLEPAKVANRLWLDIFSNKSTNINGRQFRNTHSNKWCFNFSSSAEIVSLGQFLRSFQVHFYRVPKRANFIHKKCQTTFSSNQKLSKGHDTYDMVISIRDKLYVNDALQNILVGTCMQIQSKCLRFGQKREWKNKMRKQKTIMRENPNSNSFYK